MSDTENDTRQDDSQGDSADRFTVQFWGVRGSVPTARPDRMRYGGNTSCVEIRCGEHRLIFDAGTGIAVLGDSLHGQGPVRSDLFLTHTHLDHVNGLPFFGPAYDPNNEIAIWAGHLNAGETIVDVLRRILSPPIMPVPLEALKAARRFVHFHAGNDLRPKPGILLKTLPLNHPDGAVGYRIDYRGRSACYITDYEHGNAESDAALTEFIRGTGAFIFDATYTPEEYEAGKAGWGHSTWLRACELADAAEVELLVVFHHAPEHDDDQMDAIAAAVAERRPQSVVAKEGMVLDL